MNNFPLISYLQSETNPYSHFQFVHGDAKLYDRFRRVEPTLVSILDKKSLPESDEHELIALSYNEQPIGITSLISAYNQYGPDLRKFYVRIDLVIVLSEFRGFQVSTALLLASILYILRKKKEQIYSISSLAAHKAIERNLLKFGFLIRREEDTFTHLERDLRDGVTEELLEDYSQKFQATLMALNYKLRQGKSVK